MDKTLLNTSKIFDSPQQIAHSVFTLQTKEYQKEMARLDVKERYMENVAFVQSTRDPTILKLKGNILFSVDEKIPSSSLITLGYNAGRPCKLTFQSRSDTPTSKRLFKKSPKYTVTGYLTFAKPFTIQNGLCYSVDVSIDIPHDDNEDINNVHFYLRKLLTMSTITFKCIPPRNLAFTSKENAEIGLTNLWSSNIGSTILSRLLPNYSKTLDLKTSPSFVTIKHGDKLDNLQSQLCASIFAGNLIVTCIAPAGSGKTQTIVSTVLTGIETGKKYIFVGPTNKSCDAFMNRLYSWEPTFNRILLIRSKSAMIRHPDIHNRSELYYFRKGLYYLRDEMTENDRQIIITYYNMKNIYKDLKSTPPDTWTKEYINTLNNVVKMISDLEDKLPYLIMKYVKPKIFVCTIDMLVGGLHNDYTKINIDYIIMDESSQVRLSTAMILLSKMPNSKICLIGDNKQLPPFDLHGVALDLYEQKLSTPILTFMQQTEVALKLFLAHNYRSHPQLVQLFSDLFYDGRLNCQTKDNDYNFLRIKFMTNISKTTPFNKAVYPYYGFQIYHPSVKHMSGSTYNPGLDPENIAVICMYKAQVNTISKTFCKTLDNYLTYTSRSDFIGTNNNITTNQIRHKLAMDTVDAFQGHEKEFVIISTSRTTGRPDDKSTNFYESENRICVALTRPKTGFFLFGDIKRMYESDTWKNVVDYMDRHRTFKAFDIETLNKIFNNVSPDTKFLNDFMDDKSELSKKLIQH
uniref:AAA_12 domain-containing protein n=1 Tax=Strongyloides papillosus TaxID=174720 RepID=A0A0N5B4M2_STREA